MAEGFDRQTFGGFRLGEPPYQPQVVRELKAGDVITVTLTMLSRFGKPMGFYGNYVVIVPDARIGERVRVRVKRVSGRYVFAEKVG